MRGRSWAVMLGAWLLAGCWWTGPVLYAPMPGSAAPVSDGRYRATDPDGIGGGTIIRFRRLPDGSFEGIEHGATKPGLGIVFARLPTENRRLWVVEVLTRDDADRPFAIYVLAEARDGGLSVETPTCKGNEPLVRAAGGEVAPLSPSAQADDRCTFADRPSLERALTAFARAHPVLAGQHWTRIGA